jgi:hypothetical protein
MVFKHARRLVAVVLGMAAALYAGEYIVGVDTGNFAHPFSGC